MNRYIYAPQPNQLDGIMRPINPLMVHGSIAAVSQRHCNPYSGLDSLPDSNAAPGWCGRGAGCPFGFVGG